MNIQHLRRALYVLTAACSLLSAAPLYASSYTLHLGPPGVGSGGANPVSIPPINPLEYEFEYITKSDYETNVAISPGVFFGKRTKFSSTGAYVGLGGGVVIDTNGVGPGVYSSLGYNTDGKMFQLNFEVKQAIGIEFTHRIFLNPYAIRVGITLVL